MALLVSCALAPACDSPAPVAVDAAPAPTPDASSIDGALGVACRGADCEPGAICCREVIVPGQASHYCMPEVAQCLAVPYSCDGPEDCAMGETCCDFDDQVRCEAGACGTVICHSDDHCPPGRRCCDTPFGVVKTCEPGC